MNLHTPYVLPAAGEDDRLLLAPSLERRRLQCYLALIVSDLIAVMLGSWLAGYLYLGANGGTAASIQAQLILPIFLTIALYNGAYSIRALQRPVSGIARTHAALLIATFILVFIAFYTKSSEDFSRMAVTLACATSMLFLAASRWQMRRFIAWRCGDSVFNVLVIDDGGPEVEIPGAIHVSARELALTPALDDPHALDRIGLALRNIDRVAVS